MRGPIKVILFLALFQSPVAGAQVTSYGQYADTLVTSSSTFAWAWIHLPDDFYLRPYKKYPLIFFFHGTGQDGRNEAGLDSLIATTVNGTEGAGPPWLINQGDSMNFYNYLTQDTDRPIIISPQFDNSASATGENVDYMITDLLYSKAPFAGRIDSNRISLTGLSAGGQGAFDEISGFDNNCRCFFGPVHKIASAVIMSAALNVGGGEIGYYKNLIADSTYLWGMGDTLEDPHGIATAQLIDSIHIFAGGVAAYLAPTFYLFPDTGSLYTATMGHCCWLSEYEPAFTQVINGHSLNVYQFMLLHSRVGLSPSPPHSDLYPAGIITVRKGHTIKLNTPPL